jgi:excinuclease ABC subunit C
VIDGGKGQLDAAYQALAELGLTEKLTVVGLAKGWRRLFASEILILFS